MSPKVSIAVVIRYKDDYLGRRLDTVHEHNKVITEKRKVWLGKFGAPVTPAILGLCGSKNLEMFLILVRPKGKANEPTLFMAKVSSAQNKRPSLSFVPLYYRKQYDVNTWFCLKSPIKPVNSKELESWVVASSERPLLQTLRQSNRPYFIASIKKQVKEVQAIINTVLRREPSVSSIKTAPHLKAGGEGTTEIPSIEEYDRIVQDFSQSDSM
jgi:hypothetical protein